MGRITAKGGEIQFVVDPDPMAWEGLHPDPIAGSSDPDPMAWSPDPDPYDD